LFVFPFLVFVEDCLFIPFVLVFLLLTLAYYDNPLFIPLPLYNIQNWFLLVQPFVLLSHRLVLFLFKNVDLLFRQNQELEQQILLFFFDIDNLNPSKEKREEMAIIVIHY
jgi:hypothetical protein